jgi:uncharacterized FlgJ-related protein
MLTVSIPDEIDKELSSVTTDKKEFIISAIKQKIIIEKRTVNIQKLEAEYSDSVKENNEIMKDFTHADKENWNDY